MMNVGGHRRSDHSRCPPPKLVYCLDVERDTCKLVTGPPPTLASIAFCSVTGVVTQLAYRRCDTDRGDCDGG